MAQHSGGDIIKIRGKERISYDPLWCCNELSDIIKTEDSNIHIYNTRVYIVLYDNYPKAPISFCPFCGEKIEV